MYILVLRSTRTINSAFPWTLHGQNNAVQRKRHVSHTVCKTKESQYTACGLNIILPVADFIHYMYFLLSFSDWVLWDIIHITVVIPGIIAVFKDTAGQLVKFCWKCNRRLTFVSWYIYAKSVSTTGFTVIFLQVSNVCKLLGWIQIKQSSIHLLH